MARFKSFLLISLLFGLSMFTSSAQTDDFYAQYEKFSKHAKAEYEDYRAQCNAEYVKFLERAWNTYSGAYPFNFRWRIQSQNRVK